MQIWQNERVVASSTNVAEIVENSFEHKRLLDKVKLPSLREKKMLELRFGLKGCQRKTQQEIAKYLGISHSYVSRIEKRALSKLTKGLNRISIFTKY